MTDFHARLTLQRKSGFLMEVDSHIPSCGFNAVYGPKTPDGVALDEILTVSRVLEAISRAGGGAAVAAR